MSQQEPHHQHQHHHDTLPAKLAAGGLSCMAVSFILNPMDVIKCRMQARRSIGKLFRVTFTGSAVQLLRLRNKFSGFQLSQNGMLRVTSSLRKVNTSRSSVSFSLYLDCIIIIYIFITCTDRPASSLSLTRARARASSSVVHHNSTTSTTAFSWRLGCAVHAG